MTSPGYAARRASLTQYFDRTAAEAWVRLTSDAPVSGIRATVRAGRDRMRGVLLFWLGEDLRNTRLLDAGCGTGMLAGEAALRGADVLAIDVAANLVEVAGQRLGPVTGSVTFRVGDMLDPDLGEFDAVVAMDSLIHYQPEDIVRVLSAWGARTRERIVFTVAPRTPLLALMHAAGRFFPRSDRAPAIVPVAPARLARLIAAEPGLASWRLERSERVQAGFYTSQAMELVRR